MRTRCHKNQVLPLSFTFTNMNKMQQSISSGKNRSRHFNLSVDGVLKTPNFDVGRGEVIRFCPGLIFFLIGSFEDMVIFHVFIYLSVMGRYNLNS